MSKDEWDIQDAAVRYGDARYEFGKTGGYSVQNDFRKPLDKEAYTKSCEAYGRLLDAINKHFRKSWFRKLLDLFFGD